MNGPKVNEHASLSKIWLYAGTSENPALLVRSNPPRSCQSEGGANMVREDSENVSGADNQQERPLCPGSGGERNPQRPYAGHSLSERVKRWSDLHGDMQLTAMPKVAKFLVG
jgi:hypothetical protein